MDDLTMPSLGHGPAPARAGVGLKPEHYRTIVDERPDVGWFEVHAENYMGAGGPPHAWLDTIRTDYPVSVHGVGLSIGGDRPLDRSHLARLRQVVERFEPVLVSEHLAWSTHDAGYVNDLLPVPYTREALDRVVAHVSEVQEHLRRTVLIENPATYVRFHDDEMSEVDFLEALARRSGCGLLLDVNNVLVSATNHGFDAVAYLEAFPMPAVGEIHLAGHARTVDDRGEVLCIDAHDRAVDATVWALYRRVLSRAGPRPTLVEWDADIPPWPVLLAEAHTADGLILNAPPVEGNRCGIPC